MIQIKSITSNESKQYLPSTCAMRPAQFPSFHSNQAAVPSHDASADPLKNSVVFEPLVNGRFFLTNSFQLVGGLNPSEKYESQLGYMAGGALVWQVHHLVDGNHQAIFGGNQND